MKSSKNSVLNLNRAASIKTPRNSFDMSYHTYFTSPLGMLLPNYVQDLVPGDYLEINAENFSRTQPVNTSAFCRFQENTDFYFVPYRLLWKWWDNFINQQTNTKSSLIPNSAKYEKAITNIPAVLSSRIAQVLRDSKTDGFGFQAKHGAERLLDLLGYPVSNDSSKSTASLYDIKDDKDEYDRYYNMFRVLAYQRIWNDFYRNTDYSPNKPSIYNIDDADSELIPAFTADYDRLQDMLTPQYVQWRKDRATAIKPSTLGIQQEFADNSFDINKLLPGQVNGYTPFYASPGDSMYNEQQIRSQAVADSVESIRSFTAFDKLQRIKALAGKSFDDQYKAVFGGETDKSGYNDCRYLGSFDSMLNIGEITATASGQTSGGSSNVLGQLAGKGISSGRSNQTIKFSADEHGVVLGMHYFIPFAEYDSNRLDDFNRKLKYNDIYNPAYDNLGYSPLDSTFLQYPGNFMYEDSNFVAGYQPRNMEYKTRVDEVHGEFQSEKSLSAWTAPRSVVFSDDGFTYKNLYVNPKISDTIFALKYDGSQVTDPFLCHFKFDVKKISNMSVLGLPTT